MCTFSKRFHCKNDLLDMPWSAQVFSHPPPVLVSRIPVGCNIPSARRLFSSMFANSRFFALNSGDGRLSKMRINHCITLGTSQPRFEPQRRLQRRG